MSVQGRRGLLCLFPVQNSPAVDSSLFFFLGPTAGKASERSEAKLASEQRAAVVGQMAADKATYPKKPHPKQPPITKRAG